MTEITPPPPLPDPSAHLAAAFRVVARRMAGLDFVNPALEVEAVAFAPWQGHWLGVLVTPWFMNLVLMPLDRAAWRPLPLGAKRKLRFPTGVYEFIGADDATVGEHQTCSLFSPMHEFENQAAARLVARLAREALFDPANAEQPEYPEADLSSPRRVDGQSSVEPGATRAEVAVSKRDFLRGHFSGSGDADRR